MTIQSQAILPEGGKARRVYLLLSEGIARGTYAVGTRLPGEHRLAAEFGVSRVTVRRALDALADQSAPAPLPQQIRKAG